MNQSITKLRARMKEKGVDAALVTAIDNVRWLTGFSGSFGYVVLTPDKGTFISDSRYSEQAREQVKDLDVKIFATPQTAGEIVATSAKEMGADKLGFESEHVTFASHNALKSKLNGIALEPVDDLVDSLRLVKTPDEVAKIREACALSDACFEHTKRMFQVGVTEYDIALDMEFFIRRHGAKLAFPAHVVSGARSARPHGEPSEKKLEKGDFVTLDYGAQIDGYNADITRTVIMGEPTDMHREVYDTVLKAQLAALDAIKPGVACKDVDILSREIMGDYAKYFGHSLGHGLGRVVHDIGRLSSTSTDVFAPGQVWTVEPGIYIDGFGGVRIEDDIVVTDSGCEILTKTTKEMLVF